ncbi:MAG: hypothetical protein QOF29_3046 [bacterium]
MRARDEALHPTGARPLRAAWAGSLTGETALAVPATGRAPLFRRSRTVRAALLGLLAAAGVAASALAFGAIWPGATATPEPAGVSPADAAQARAIVTRAQALVSVTPQQLGYRLRVAGPLPGVRGRADTAAKTITLFVAPHAAVHQVAHDLAHELAHAFDAERLSTAERAAYLRGRGATGASWWPGGEASDYRSGAGDFAEVFALCHAVSPEYRSRLAARPEDPCGLLPKQARGAKLAEGVS